jgi:phage terminase large subunit-like protein
VATRAKATSSRSSRRAQKPADYVAVAIAYAETVVEDRRGQRYGRWARLAARRFLADLKRARRKRPPFSWSPDQANAACGFIEQLPHVEGVWESPTITLEPAQVFFLCNLFGFRNPDGSRRFTTALFAVARKNAKSALAAAILLYVFCTEPEVGPQVLSAATTGDQARIVWGVAKRMVEKTPDLREAFTLEPFANAIARYEVGGTFRPINAKASTQDGLNPSALCFDELHAHKTRDLFDVLRSAAGARKSPLFLYTTTEGFETPGPWPEVRTFAFQVLQGVVEADHFLAVYYALDEADDDFDESKWGKANPLLDVSVSLSELRKYAIEAKQQPSALAEFRIKRLNRQASSAEGHINLLRWQKCAGAVDLEAMVGEPCWAAFDLASTRDMTAWRLLWLKDEIWWTWGRCWVPEHAVAQRNERGTVRYAPWVASGHLTVTEGDVTDFRVIEREILEDCARFNPRKIAYDPWNASQLVNQLTEHRLPLEQFRQGPQSYNPAMQALDRAYTAGNFRHGGDPILQWNAANLVARRDVNMNMAPDRKRSAEKIDAIVALLMAFGVASVPEERREYEAFFL